MPTTPLWSIAASWKLKSSAVAMPAFAMANVTLIFYTVVMVVKKKRTSEDNRLQMQASKPLI